MTSSILTRTASVTINPSAPQSEVDSQVSDFIDEALDAKTLVSFGAASFAGRLASLRVMSSEWNSSLLRPLSSWVGLGAEAASFELTHRSLLSLSTQDSIRGAGLWSWSGPLGLGQGFLNSFLNFGILKIGGALTREQNIVARHLFQSAALVAAQTASSQLGMSPTPEGSLAEQLLHSETTNLQWEGAMGLLPAALPGFFWQERTLDRSLENKSSLAFGPPFRFSLSPTISVEVPSIPSAAPTKILNPDLWMSSSKEGGGKGRRLKIPEPSLALPVLSAERNQDLTHQAEHLERLSQIWLDRLDPDTNPSFKEKLGGNISLEELMKGLPEFLSEHQKFIASWILEIQKPENRGHPDHDTNLSAFNAIADRIEGMIGASGEFRGEIPQSEELKDFLTTLYQGANVLIGLGQANIYDPKYIVDALDHYEEALLDWIGYLHPDRSYDLVETASDTTSESMASRRKATQDLETRRLLKRLFGPRISPEDFTEAYPDLHHLSFKIAHGKFILLGERWNKESEIREGQIERQFIFLGGHWNVLRNYEPLPPPQELNRSAPLPYRAPAWEPEETKRRLEKEFTLFQRLEVERLLPMDMDKPYWNIPFATFDWFRKRFSSHLGQFHKDIPWQSASTIKETHQIALFRDEKTKAPVGADFLHDLNVSWEGILSLPPNGDERKRFESYYAGRRAMEQRKEIEGKLVDLKKSIGKASSSIKESLQKFASLIQFLSQQTTLRHRIDLGWTGLHTMREHLARLETLRGNAQNKREKENLKQEIEKGIGLVEKALRPLPLSSEGPF